MGLEKDIHQNKFRSTRHKAMINIMFTYGWLLERIKKFLEKEGVTHQQYNILRILRGSAPDPLSTLQIRERMIDKMSDTSRIVDRLIVKELVKKCACCKDKRLVDVTITDKGQKLLKKLDAESDHIDQIMNKLTEIESGTLNLLLDKLRNID